MDQLDATDFTIGDDDYTVVRYAAPTTRDEWVELLGLLVGLGPVDAAMAYDAMFPDGYDPNGTDEVALQVGPKEETP